MRIERLIACTPSELWRALILHTELGEPGPMLRLAFPAGISGTAAKITVYESEKVLECAWGGDVLRWELHACDGMTRLVFTHAECAAQWLAYLDNLAAIATGDSAMEISA